MLYTVKVLLKIHFCFPPDLPQIKIFMEDTLGNTVIEPTAIR
jgi:hypothetical protein